MFREFNVKFEDVEMLGGADNLLEGTEITKVIVRGDNNKMSSLDSMLKNCNELDTVEGELDLNGVSDIDNLLEGTELVKSIDLKNINNENISANNSFPHVDQINIGGELYNKKAMQNVIASKDWTFDDINYSGTVGDNIVTKEVNIVDDNKTTIQDTLEQKAKGIEIIGQTYENLVVGSGEATLLDELTLESVDGSPNEFTPHIEQPVCVECIEGETYQNLIEGKGEYKLTDTFSTTWTESNNSIENPPSMIEIPEIWGNTIQGYANVVTEKMIYDSITNSSVATQVTLNSDNSLKISNWGDLDSWIPTDEDMEKHSIKLKPNTTYSMCAWRKETGERLGALARVESDGFKGNHNSSYKFTTDSTGRVFLCPYGYVYNYVVRVYEGDIPNIADLYEFDLNYIQSVGDLYVNGRGEPILDEEGNEQYKLEIESSNTLFNEKYLKEGFKKELYNGRYVYHATGSTIDNGLFVYNKYKFKENTQYHIKYECANVNNLTWKVLQVAYTDGTANNYTTVVDNLEGKNHIITQVNKTVSKLGFTIEGRYNPLYIYADSIIISETDDNYDLIETDKTTILMPQPLRKVANGRDRLYWDLSNRKYYIEKNIFSMIIDGTQQYIIVWRKDGYVAAYTPVSSPGKVFGMTIIANTLPVISQGEDDPYRSPRECVYTAWDSKIYFCLKGEHDFNYKWFVDNPITVYYHGDSSQIVETKILEKPSLEAYSPKTYITTSAEIQPSQMSVTNKKVDYIPLGLQPNKDYTLQLDSTGKNDKPITVNLGGTETTIQPTNDTIEHHKVVVRTPSTLTTDKLDLSGEGVVVNDVMLFEGGSNEIRQEVEYVEGIESIGKYTITKNKFPNNIVFTKDRTLLNDGTIYGGTTTDYATEDYILCNLDVNKVYSISSPFTYKKVAFYDESKKFISIINTNTNTYLNGFSIPSNAKYYRVSVNNSAGKEIKIQIEEGNTHTSYEEYFEGERYKIDILSHNGQEKNCFTYDLFEKSTVSSSAGWSIFDLGLNMNGSFKLTVKNNSGYNGLIIKIADTPSEISVNSGYQSSYSGNLKGKLCIAVYWNTTGIFVGNGKGKTELSSLIKEGKLEIIIDSDDTNLNYYYEKDSTQSILLPQPLNKIGDIKDKFYWDEDKGHYCIEQNFGYTQFDGTESWGNNGTNYNLKITGKMKNSSCKIMTSCDLKFFSLNNDYIYLPSSAFGEGLNQTSKLKKYLSDNKPYLYYQLEYSNIIDLPYLNKKYSLDTYMPTTYLECANTSMQPSRILLESDTVRYKPSVLETNTDYTVQFECKEKSNKKIKLNLGGSEKEVDAIVGLNHVSITTPNELSKDRLFLSGIGNKVDNVMVVKGEMNQHPEYFDGVQNVGVLQGDKYKIDIKTNEGFALSIKSIKPIAKNDKLYWNKSNKRYEIDRSGSIEVPTVTGDVIDLPRLYQKEDTNFTIESGNIKPSKIKVNYLDID